MFDDPPRFAAPVCAPEPLAPLKIHAFVKHLMRFSFLYNLLQYKIYENKRKSLRVYAQQNIIIFVPLKYIRTLALSISN
jgi:hypothetical protein